jgi:hypothetical protein
MTRRICFAFFVFFSILSDVTAFESAAQPAEKRENERRPAMVFFHGGGWVSGEPAWAFSQARHFASLGMVAAAVQYRLSDQITVTPLEAMTDTRASIRWLRTNAKMLGIDVKRVAAYGWSAGGHLAASAAIFKDADQGVGHLFTPDSLDDNGWPRPDKKIQADALKKTDEFLAGLGFIRSFSESFFDHFNDLLSIILMIRFRLPLW